jgi:hypothetical protein
MMVRKYGFLAIYAFLNTDMVRCERSKRSHKANCGHRRCSESFVLWSHCHLLLGLIYPHRESIARETEKVALSSESLHKS